MTYVPVCETNFYGPRVRTETMNFWYGIHSVTGLRELISKESPLNMEYPNTSYILHFTYFLGLFNFM